MRTVAILCTSFKTAYKSLEGVEVYDKRRDARTFPGGMPIVAHPPCRAWVRAIGSPAKPEPGERELGVWCCAQLRACGGVLEQPVNSKLFQAGGLPLPNEGDRDGLWTEQVWQAWWGYGVRKQTWLCFAGIARRDIVFPFSLHPPNQDRAMWDRFSTRKRAMTVPALAQWLVAAARNSTTLPV